MAVVIETSCDDEENDEDETFVFDEWLIKHNLFNLKQIFIDHNMSTLPSLNLNNKNFSSLITDNRLLNKQSSIQNIIIAIQSLDTYRPNISLSSSNSNNNHYHSSLILISDQETNISAVKIHYRKHVIYCI